MFLRPLRLDQHPPLLSLCLPSSKELLHFFPYLSLGLTSALFSPTRSLGAFAILSFPCTTLNPSTFHSAPPSSSDLSHKDSVPQYICVTISCYNPVFLYLTHPACLLSGVKMCNPVLGVGWGAKEQLGDAGTKTASDP